MTNQVDADDRRVRYVVTNPSGQSVFQINFPLTETTWIRVYVDGVVQASGYTVDLSALSVTFSSPVAEGKIVTLEGLQILERENGYPLNGDLSSRLINSDINFLIRSMQELRRDLDQKIGASKAEADDTVLTMPVLSGNEGKAILVGPGGFTLSSSNFGDLDTVVAEAEAAKDAAIVAQGETEDARDATVIAQGLAEDARDSALDALASANLPASLGAANTVLKVNAGGTAPEYGKIAVASIDDTALASQADAEAGSAPDKLMTSERTAQAIAALAPDNAEWVKSGNAVSFTSQSYVDIPITAATKIKFKNLSSNQSNAALRMRFSTDGGSTFKTGGSDYAYAIQALQANQTSVQAFRALGDNMIELGVGQSLENSSGNDAYIEIIMPNPTDAEARCIALYRGGGVSDSAVYSENSIGVANYNTAGAINCIRVYPSAGTISGTYQIYLEG